MQILFDCTRFAKSHSFGLGIVNSRPTPAPLPPQAKPARQSSIGQTARELPTPRTGRGLFRLACEFSRMTELDCVKALVRWGCQRRLGGRIVAWPAEVVSEAHAELLALVDAEFDAAA